MLDVEGIERRWAEARADVISKMVEDILRRYQRMHSGDKYLVVLAFEHSLHAREDDLDDEDKDAAIAEMNAEQKEGLATFLMKSTPAFAKTRGSGVYAGTSWISAEGVALLSFYVELQALPGHQAMGLVKAIEDWRSAAQSDLKISN